MNSTLGVPYSNDYLSNMTTNPTVLIVLSIVIIGYYTLFASLNVANGESVGSAAASAGKGIVFMEVLLWGVFVLLILMNGMQYIFNTDITASIKNLFSGEPEIDIVVDPDDIAGDSISGNESTVPEIKISKQVFHVPDNKYGYEDAKAICRAYGGRLATIKEMQDAYEEGADWCGYGWSDGQMALYPTQYDKWAQLQKIEGHEHDCGRPGVNGGYIENPNVKFGINCYGYKPQITQDEAEAMQMAPLYPKTLREQQFEKRVDYWRGKLSEIIVSPFNHNNWSKI